METARRQVMLVGAVILLLGAVLIALYSGSREPSYQGKMLSEWLESGDDSWDRLPQKEAEAVRVMGTNAIPFLLEWVQYEPPAWQIALLDSRVKRLFIKLFDNQIRREMIRAEHASIAFEAFGPKANFAIPELTKLLNSSSKNETVAWTVALALAKIGKDALPSLTSALTNRQAVKPGIVFTAITKMGTNALPAMPELIQHLQDTNENFVAHAILALGELHLQPDLVVPALTNFLVHSQMGLRIHTARALEQFGPAGLSAVPYLQRLLSSSTPIMRVYATNALLKIAPETLTNAPTR